MPAATWIADQALLWGLEVVEHDGWRTRSIKGRKSGAPLTFEPRGVLWHHTAGSPKGDAPSVQVVINGTGSLSGPLAQIVLARSGTVHVTAAGYCYHAGKGSWPGIKSGNRELIGIEAENTGVGEPWPKVQLDAYVRLTAALLTRMGSPASMAIGHKEYAPKRKIDPYGLDMDEMRARVATEMIRGSSAGAAPAAPASSGSTGAPTKKDTWTLIQAMLTSLGYDPGPIDGLPGSKTKKAMTDALGAHQRGQLLLKIPKRSEQPAAGVLSARDLTVLRTHAQRVLDSAGAIVETVRPK